jgi:DNA repair ATPase RecN
VTAAAAAVESETFDAHSLDEVAQRSDALGQLARVFQRMAREVYAREQRLKAEVQQLRIEIDEVRKAREVAEITDSGYFKNLRTKAKEARNRREDNSG